MNLQMKFKGSRAVFFATFTLLASLSHAETDDELLSNGQWHDKDTGLTWMRCSYGEYFENGECQGTIKPVSWQEAIQISEKPWLNKNGWRLPTMEELYGLITCNWGFTEKQEFFDNKGKYRSFKSLCRGKKNLNQLELLTLDYMKFPEKKIQRTSFDEGQYWTIYSSQDRGTWAGFVGFNSGSVDLAPKSKRIAVRLVRGGDLSGYFSALPHVQNEINQIAIDQKSISNQQQLASNLSDRIDGDLLKKGYWKDPDSQLIWSMCPLGIVFENGKCKDRNILYDVATAALEVNKLRDLGFDNWRIPTYQELKVFFEKNALLQGKSTQPLQYLPPRFEDGWYITTTFDNRADTIKCASGYWCIKNKYFGLFGTNGVNLSLFHSPDKTSAWDEYPSISLYVRGGDSGEYDTLYKKAATLILGEKDDYIYKDSYGREWTKCPITKEMTRFSAPIKLYIDGKTQCGGISGTKMNYYEAVEKAHSLAQGWRLPTDSEFSAFRQELKAKDAPLFNVLNSPVWLAKLYTKKDPRPYRTREIMAETSLDSVEHQRVSNQNLVYFIRDSKDKNLEWIKTEDMVLHHKSELIKENSIAAEEEAEAVRKDKIALEKARALVAAQKASASSRSSAVENTSYRIKNVLSGGEFVEIECLPGRFELDIKTLVRRSNGKYAPIGLGEYFATDFDTVAKNECFIH